MLTLYRALKRQREILHLSKNASIEQIEEKLHHLDQGQYVGDAIYGAMDGVVTTFALIAGAFGASLSPIYALILGLANLFAGGFSMGVGDFMARRSEQLYYVKQKKIEEWEMKNFRDIELEQLHQIYRKKGFKGKELDNVVKVISKDKTIWMNEILQEYLGIVSEHHQPFKSAIITFFAYLAAGILPLFPIIFGIEVDFWTMLVVIAVVLFVIGIVRSRITVMKWYRSGLEIMAGGVAASLIAYGVGKLFGGLV